MSANRLIVGILAFFIAGCSSINLGKSDESLVRERAQARLNALLASEIKQAWSYTSPTFRQAVPWNSYTLYVGGAGNWTQAEVKDVKCEADRCEVGVQVSYEIREFKMQNTRMLDEVWIKADSQWWIYHKRR